MQKRKKRSASCGNWAHFSVSSSSPSPEVKGKGMLPLTPISKNPKNALWQLPENRCRLLPMKPGSVVRQAVCPLPRTVFCYSHMHKKKVKWWLQSLEYFNLRWWVFPWRMYFFFFWPETTFDICCRSLSCLSSKFFRVQFAFRYRCDYLHHDVPVRNYFSTFFFCWSTGLRMPALPFYSLQGLVLTWHLAWQLWSDSRQSCWQTRHSFHWSQPCSWRYGAASVNPKLLCCCCCCCRRRCRLCCHRNTSVYKKQSHSM